MLRQDPISGHCVIVASNRARRPHQLRRTEVRLDDVVCPFCEGQEATTTAEVFAFRDASSQPDQPGWRVRVVPNKYPALELGAGTGSLGRDGDRLFPIRCVEGIHEVFIESAEHLTSISRLNNDRLAEVVAAYLQRMRHFRNDRRIRSAIIFKNVGAAAGASLEHVHSQLMATSFVPHTLAVEVDNGARFFSDHQRCYFCELVGREAATSDRVVFETGHFLVICPFASRFPYEMCILPKQHLSHFENLPEHQAADLADVLRKSVVCLERSLEEATYNFLIHTAPFDMPDLEYYHWHVEVLPRTSGIAGYEWGTGCYINPNAPEDAARALRQWVQS